MTEKQTGRSSFDSIRMSPEAEQSFLEDGANWPQPADGGVGIMTDTQAMPFFHEDRPPREGPPPHDEHEA